MSDGYDYRRVDVPRLLEALGIEAKRDGAAWRARCPYHQEKSPSWSIVSRPGRDDNGLWHCFGCSESGTALALAAHVLEVGTAAAREWVVEKAISAPPPPLSARVALRGPSAAFRLPPGVEVHPTEKWPPSVLRYALSRGITPDQIRRWGIGYALSGRCQSRVVIPVRDARGQLATYTARSFAGDEPKYQTPHKSERPNLDVVFGEERWPLPAARGELVVLEGAINALAVERVDQRPFAALLGSELRPGQAMRIATFRRVLVLTDPDAAGEKAAGKVAALGRHVDVVRLEVPAGEDAQSLGPARLREVLRCP